MVWPIDDVVRMIDLFLSDVALSDPLSFFLVILGAVTIALSLGVFTILTAQGIVVELNRFRTDVLPALRG
jgi:hypothetical protein